MSDHKQDSGSVDLAINQVLEAEREARNAVEDCRKQAAALVAAGEQEARGIARRAERRIQQAHRLADAAVEKALEELVATASSPESEATGGADARRLEQAVDRLAGEIVGPLP